ncbi:MAG: hypothetical protein AAB592_01655, partial [Patescibacteria group bacterium]
AGVFEIEGKAPLGRLKAEAYHSSLYMHDPCDGEGRTWTISPYSFNNSFREDIRIKACTPSAKTIALAGTAVAAGILAVIFVGGSMAGAGAMDSMGKKTRDTSPLDLLPTDIDEPTPRPAPHGTTTSDSSAVSIYGKVWCPSASPARGAIITVDYSGISSCTDQTVHADGNGEYNVNFCSDEAATLRAKHPCGTFEESGFSISSPLEKNIRLRR